MFALRHLAAGACAAAALLLGAATPQAQAPAAGALQCPRGISLIIPYAPGGVTDTAGRMMGAALERELGVSVQVLNRAGAASQIGLGELVRSRPDGCSLSYAVLPTVVTHYIEAQRTPPYTRGNFQPIGNHHLSPQTLAVRADSPYRTLRELVEAARAAPETISVSTSGQLAVPHSQVLMLEHVAGVKFVSVHFTGGAPSVTALLGGHVNAFAGGTADSLPHHRSGAFRVLAVAAAERDSSMPTVPTMREQGFDVLAASATGIVAPAGTPGAVVQALSAAMKRVIDSAEHRRQLIDFSLIPAFMDPDAYAAFWTDTEQRMGPVLRTIRPN